MAIKDSIGGWKDNAAAYSATAGCSSFKFFWGGMWERYTRDFNYPTNKCPIPKVIFSLNIVQPNNKMYILIFRVYTRQMVTNYQRIFQNQIFQASFFTERTNFAFIIWINPKKKWVVLLLYLI